jgi:hypothetical protein
VEPSLEADANIDVSYLGSEGCWDGSHPIFFDKIMELSLLIFTLETYQFCMKCIELSAAALLLRFHVRQEEHSHFLKERRAHGVYRARLGNAFECSLAMVPSPVLFGSGNCYLNLGHIFPRFPRVTPEPGLQFLQVSAN